MMPFDFSKMMLDDLPFSEIFLSGSEMRRLRRCAKRNILETKCDRLVCYGFAAQVKSCTCGSTMPKPNGYVSITPRGMAYLDYRREESRRYLIPQLLALLAVLVSFASLALDVIDITCPKP